MTTAADLTILRYLARRARATASQIAKACAMAENEAGTHLIKLKFMQLVADQQDIDSGMTERCYTVIPEGRRKAATTSM